MVPTATLILVFKPAPELDMRKLVGLVTEAGGQLVQAEVRVEPVEHHQCRCQMVHKPKVRR